MQVRGIPRHNDGNIDLLRGMVTAFFDDLQHELHIRVAEQVKSLFKACCEIEVRPGVRVRYAL